jgi:hypothetical protein
MQHAFWVSHPKFFWHNSRFACIALISCSLAGVFLAVRQASKIVSPWRSLAALMRSFLPGITSRLMGTARLRRELRKQSAGGIGFIRSIHSY